MPARNYVSTYFSGKDTWDAIPTNKHNSIREYCIRALMGSQREKETVLLAPSHEWITDHADYVADFMAAYPQGSVVVDTEYLAIMRLAIDTLETRLGYAKRTLKINTRMIRTINRAGGSPDSILGIRLTAYEHCGTGSESHRLGSNATALRYRTQYLSYSQVHEVIRLDDPTYHLPKMVGKWIDNPDYDSSIDGSPEKIRIEVKTERTSRQANTLLIYRLPKGAYILGATVDPFEKTWADYDKYRAKLGGWIDTTREWYTDVKDLLASQPSIDD